MFLVSNNLLKELIFCLITDSDLKFRLTFAVRELDISAVLEEIEVLSVEIRQFVDQRSRYVSVIVGHQMSRRSIAVRVLAFGELNQSAEPCLPEDK